MKRLTFTVLTLYLISLIPLTLFSQTPQKIDFQAIARDAEGIPIASQAIGVKITIVKDSIGGTVFYEQADTLTTDISGLFTLKIGDGNEKTGNFSEIDWGIGSYYTKVAIDKEGGTNYIEMGAMEMVSVPYALHARNTESWMIIDDTTYSMKNVQIGNVEQIANLSISGKIKAQNDYPIRKQLVHERILFGYAGDENLTAGSSWTEIEYHYQPFGYAVPDVQFGATRYFRLYAIYSDNMQGEGENQIMIEMVDGTEVHFILPRTNGGVTYHNRDAYSDWMPEPDTILHATSKIRTSITGTTVSLHYLKLQTWDFFE